MRFLVYLTRWIVSGIVMLPVVELLSLYVPLWANILLAQIFGACVFYYIDRKIFE